MGPRWLMSCVQLPALPPGRWVSHVPNTPLVQTEGSVTVEDVCICSFYRSGCLCIWWTGQTLPFSQSGKLSLWHCAGQGQGLNDRVRARWRMSHFRILSTPESLKTSEPCLSFWHLRGRGWRIMILSQAGLNSKLKADLCYIAKPCLKKVSSKKLTISFAFSLGIYTWIFMSICLPWDVCRGQEARKGPWGA